jgi:hypothetical protein
MDKKEYIGIRDYLENKVFNGQVMNRVALEGAELLSVHLRQCDMTISVVRYSDGTYFTPSDWQGKQPENASEIADVDWVRDDGTMGILFDGLPRDSLFIKRY